VRVPQLPSFPPKENCARAEIRLLANPDADSANVSMGCPQLNCRDAGGIVIELELLSQKRSTAHRPTRSVIASLQIDPVVRQEEVG
jgi:hypothetical protein